MTPGKLWKKTKREKKRTDMILVNTKKKLLYVCICNRTELLVWYDLMCVGFGKASATDTCFHKSIRI